MVLMNVKLAVFILTVINTWLKPTNIIKQLLMIFLRCSPSWKCSLWCYRLRYQMPCWMIMIARSVLLAQFLTLDNFIIQGVRMSCWRLWLDVAPLYHYFSFFHHPRCVEVLLEQRQEPKVWEVATSCRGASPRPLPCLERWAAYLLNLECFFK